MALDPYSAQLWWNANDPRVGTLGQIEAKRLLAQRAGLAWNPDTQDNAALDTQIAAWVTQQNGGSATTPADTAANRSLFGQMAQYLNESGLGELFTIDASGNPGGWLWDQITAGIDSSAVLQTRLEDTDAFRRNYGIITELRKKAAAGEPVQVPTVAQVRDYRTTVRSLMRASGLPQWFYDENADADKLMASGLSPAEIEQRLGNVWTMVADSNPAIKQTFEQFYGVGDGEGALAAYFLDPEHTQAKLEVAARTAFTAGQGSTLGLDVSREVAARVASSQMSIGQIESNLADAASLKPLTVASVGERASGTLSADNAVEATVLGDAAAKQAFQRRSIERQAVDRSAGGAAVSSRGVVGVG